MTKNLPKHSILEPELSSVAEQGKIERIQVVETTDGFYVVTDVQERPPESLYLATRREPDQPRMFSDLKRLNSLLRTMYPEGTIELTCESTYNAKSTKKAAKKKVSKKKAKGRK